MGSPAETATPFGDCIRIVRRLGARAWENVHLRSETVKPEAVMTHGIVREY
jgi:hypothetical protein